MIKRPAPSHVPSAPRVIVAMDFSEPLAALAMAKRLDPGLCRLKVGNELFTAGGPRIVEAFHELGFDVFLDLKYHDIPNTVAGAVASAARLGVWMVNVHAGGGVAMLKAAKDSLAPFESPPLLIAVTVLTSLSSQDLSQLGWSPAADQLVATLAGMAWQVGFDGLVCSAQEASLLREQLSNDDDARQPVLVTPGIRPKGSGADDQFRIMTPGQAILAGSSYLVIGRPITQSDDPLGILRNITKEIAG